MLIIFLSLFLLQACGFKSDLDVQFDPAITNLNTSSTSGSKLGSISASGENNCSYTLKNYNDSFRLVGSDIYLNKNSPAQGDYPLELQAVCEDQVPRKVIVNVYIAASPWLTQLGSTTVAPFGYSSTGAEPCWDSVIDKDDNIYCGGHVFADYAETIGGIRDPYISKVDKDGNLIWIRQIGTVTAAANSLDSSGNDSCQAIAISDTAVYCAGYATGSFAEANGGGLDALIIKYDLDGNFIWASQLGAISAPAVSATPTSNDYCYGIAIDKDENIYCSGRTSSNLAETNGGGFDSFIIKMNSSGVIQWVRHLGTTTATAFGADISGSDQCFHIAIDSNSNLYCVFQTVSPLLEGSGGGNDIAIIKYDKDGNALMLKHLGPTTISSLGGEAGSDDLIYEAKVDKQDNLVVCGITDSSLFSTNAGLSDAYIFKMNPSGNITHYRQFGTDQIDQCEGIDFDKQNNIVIAGASAGNLFETTTSIGDAFIQKLSPSLIPIWGVQNGSQSESKFGVDHTAGERCISLVLDSKENAICTGATDGSLKEPNASVDAFFMRVDKKGIL